MACIHFMMALVSGATCGEGSAAFRILPAPLTAQRPCLSHPHQTQQNAWPAATVLSGHHGVLAGHSGWNSLRPLLVRSPFQASEEHPTPSS